MNEHFFKNIKRVSYIFILILIFVAGNSFFNNNLENKPYFNLTFNETIYMFFVVINIILLIEIYNIFVKKLASNQKKEDFIFKQLELFLQEIQSRELKKWEQKEEDYKRYLMIQRKITNRLELIEKLCKEYTKNSHIENEIKEISKKFSEYKDFSAEKIQNIIDFNSQITEYEKVFNQIEMKTYNLQAMILDFESLKENKSN
ncbi:MAG: hypothetical protein ACLUBL_07315 [Fusobacterium sp.]|uniref:hypothetical protein n=1 Tax=Fusobacterium sp. TaxID=68766 RepID=UPI003991DD06